MLYTSTVGNKAVQEAIAARSFYRADFAAVVCKHEYPPAAKQLAAAAKVDLMSYAELDSYAGKLAGQTETVG